MLNYLIVVKGIFQEDDMTYRESGLYLLVGTILVLLLGFGIGIFWEDITQTGVKDTPLTEV